jgi:hypothetical protein
MKSLPSRTCKASSKSSESTSKTKNLVLLPSRDNKQVGSGLVISEITVKAHRSNVMQKMNADSLPDHVKITARLRLAPAPKLRWLDYSDLFNFVLPVWPSANAELGVRFTRDVHFLKQHEERSFEDYESDNTKPSVIHVGTLLVAVLKPSNGDKQRHQSLMC